MEFILKYNDGSTQGYKTIECNTDVLSKAKKQFENEYSCKVSFIAYKEVYNLLVDYMDDTNKNDLFSARVQKLALGQLLLSNSEQDKINRIFKEVELIKEERHIKKIEKLLKKC